MGNKTSKKRGRPLPLNHLGRREISADHLSPRNVPLPSSPFRLAFTIPALPPKDWPAKVARPTSPLRKLSQTEKPPNSPWLYSTGQPEPVRNSISSLPKGVLSELNAGSDQAAAESGSELATDDQEVDSVVNDLPDNDSSAGDSQSNNELFSDSFVYDTSASENVTIDGSAPTDDTSDDAAGDGPLPRGGPQVGDDLSAWMLRQIAESVSLQENDQALLARLEPIQPPLRSEVEADHKGRELIAGIYEFLDQNKQHPAVSDFLVDVTYEAAIAYFGMFGPPARLMVQADPEGQQILQRVFQILLVNTTRPAVKAFLRHIELNTAMTKLVRGGQVPRKTLELINNTWIVGKAQTTALSHFVRDKALGVTTSPLLDRMVPLLNRATPWIATLPIAWYFSRSFSYAFHHREAVGDHVLVWLPIVVILILILVFLRQHIYALENYVVDRFTRSSPAIQSAHRSQGSWLCKSLVVIFGGAAVHLGLIIGSATSRSDNGAAAAALARSYNGFQRAMALPVEAFGRSYDSLRDFGLQCTEVLKSPMALPDHPTIASTTATGSTASSQTAFVSSTVTAIPTANEYIAINPFKRVLEQVTVRIPEISFPTIAPPHLTYPEIDWSPVTTAFDSFKRVLDQVTVRVSEISLPSITPPHLKYPEIDWSPVTTGMGLRAVGMTAMILGFSIIAIAMRHHLRALLNRMTTTDQDILCNTPKTDVPRTTLSVVLNRPSTAVQGILPNISNTGISRTTSNAVLTIRNHLRNLSSHTVGVFSALVISVVLSSLAWWSGITVENVEATDFVHPLTLGPILAWAILWFLPFVADPVVVTSNCVVWCRQCFKYVQQLMTLSFDTVWAALGYTRLVAWTGLLWCVDRVQNAWNAMVVRVQIPSGVFAGVRSALVAALRYLRNLWQGLCRTYQMVLRWLRAIPLGRVWVEWGVIPVLQLLGWHTLLFAAAWWWRTMPILLAVDVRGKEMLGNIEVGTGLYVSRA